MFHWLPSARCSWTLTKCPSRSKASSRVDSPLLDICRVTTRRTGPRRPHSSLSVGIFGTIAGAYYRSGAPDPEYRWTRLNAAGNARDGDGGAGQSIASLLMSRVVAPAPTSLARHRDSDCEPVRGPAARQHRLPAHEAWRRAKSAC